ncbi:hypothetical protein [Streptomyces sp. NBC_01565]|uniref:hypothetical protein n=1 Tax=Streptomyces sp. NBC_01565 TaxID=2975881 RepID=UPI00224CA099|nr:hypothetical protein [Streptomyces sp. NBC_01565]MCX4542688.1 hypothetical protein [Streptomyces sp. NBC_01565]
MAAYTSVYLAEIVADYQTNVEPTLLREREMTPAAQKTAMDFAARWPQDAIRAALDALDVAYAIRNGSSASVIAGALANLGR